MCFRESAQKKQKKQRKGLITMNITDVRVRKVAKEGKMKAVVSITIDEEFVVHDIKVIEGEKVCLSPCQAEKHRMENIVILHIPLILEPEKRFSGLS